jgi:hypothetical protein
VKIIDEVLLDEFRTAPRCEWCARQRPVVANRTMFLPAVAATLSGLISALAWSPSIAGVMTAPTSARFRGKQLLAIIARRQRRPAEEIELEILRLPWAPKGKQVARALALRDRGTTHTRTKLGRAL